MDQKIVPFYGDQLVALQDDRGIRVALKPMCDSLPLVGVPR